MPHPSLYAQAPKYCHYYFDLIESDDLLLELEKNRLSTEALIQSIPESLANFAYAENKWTLKEVIRHIIETERILSYRALRFSRSDATELPGFDENHYITCGKNMQYNLQDLLIEFNAVRNASICLFKPLTNEMSDFMGAANNLQYSAKMIGFLMTGHAIHHCNIIRERYLTSE